MKMRPSVNEKLGAADAWPAGLMRAGAIIESVTMRPGNPGTENCISKNYQFSLDHGLVPARYLGDPEMSRGILGQMFGLFHACVLAQEWLSPANELTKNTAFGIYAVAATIVAKVLWSELSKQRKKYEESQNAHNEEIAVVQKERLASIEGLQGARVQDAKDTFRQLLDNNDAVVTALQGAAEALNNQSKPAELIREAIKQLAQEQRNLIVELARNQKGVTPRT